MYDAGNLSHEYHPSYGSMGVINGPQWQKQQCNQEFKELNENSQLEMEKLVFNCDERIFAEEHHRLFHHLGRFSALNFQDERQRIFYHRLFWIIMLVIIMAVILRVAFVYAAIHEKSPHS